MKEVSANFFGSFNKANNVKYNLEIINTLIEKNENGIFNKPIIILIGSCIEAVLGDLLMRIDTYNKEGVKSISKEEQNNIKSREPKDKEWFSDVVKLFKKNKIIPEKMSENIFKLIKLRNKVHISVEEDEETKFTNLDLNLFTILLYELIDYVSNNYNRTGKYYNKNFIFTFINK